MDLIANPSEAVTLLIEAVDEAQDQWRYIYALARAYAVVGQFVEALKAYDRVLDRPDSGLEVHIEAALVDRLTGDFASAIRRLNSVLRRMNSQSSTTSASTKEWNPLRYVQESFRSEPAKLRYVRLTLAATHFLEGNEDQIQAVLGEGVVVQDLEELEEWVVQQHVAAALNIVRSASPSHAEGIGEFIRIHLPEARAYMVARQN